MSRIPTAPGSRIAQPTGSRIPKPPCSSLIAQPIGAKITQTCKTCPKKAKAAAAAEQPPEPGEYAVPALSIAPKKPIRSLNIEKLRKEMKRRLAPDGEDLRGIKRVMHSVKDSKTITVQEFVNLISPYTSDNGAYLRKFMADDTAAFQKLARKVYETMTQDVSDVIVNEQVQISLFYEERQNSWSEKMMHCIDEIYTMIPNFDFNKFYELGPKYFATILVVPEEIMRDEEEVDLERRQHAYHRMQWLKTEGERLNQENSRLAQRLAELKDIQQLEQDRAQNTVAVAEERRRSLIEEEQHMKNTLEKLNDSLEKSVIQSEMEVCEQSNLSARRVHVPEELSLSGKKKGGKKKKKAKTRPEWVSEIAADIDQSLLDESMAIERRNIQEMPSTSAAGPSEGDAVEVRKEETSVTVQRQRQSRPSLGPKDTWGGFA